MADAETVVMPAIRDGAPAASLIKDPAPSGRRFPWRPGTPVGDTAGPGAGDPGDGTAGGVSTNATGPVLLAMSLGVLTMSWAAAQARETASQPVHGVLWLLGLALVFAPPAVRIVASRTSATERIALAVALPVVLQLSRLVLNPTRFAFHDELLHLNTLRQIEESGRLFSENSLLPVSGFYPGMEIVTDAVRDVTGLSAFASAALVLLASRVVLALGVIALVTRVTGSVRAGAIGSLVYVLNSQFLFFNSQYSYQTMALPLAILVVHLLVTRHRGSRTSLVLPLVAIAGVSLTHHVTSILLTLALAVWLVAELVLRRGAHRDVTSLVVTTAFSAVTTVVAALNPGSPVRSYLGAIATSSQEQITELVDGGAPRTAFANSAGAGPLPYERGLIVAAVVLVCVSLVGALLYARSSLRTRDTLGVVLAVVALLYPIIPSGSLTQATAEVGQRAAGFVFLGTATVMGWWLWRRTVRVRTALVVGLLATVTFVGNVVLGAGASATQLPGPYLISADSRSLDPDNVAAARWLEANVPAETRVYGDRVSGLLAASVGGQYNVRNVSTNIDASRLILDPDFTFRDVDLLRATGIQYVIVDSRLANGLPNQDVYIENGEFGGDDRTAPVPEQALAKLDAVPGVDRVYDNGSVAIYSVGRLA